MKKLGMLGIIGGAALLIATPFFPQWSQDEVSLSLNSANARIIPGAHRRAYRRTYRRAAYATAAAGVAGYGYGSYYGYRSPSLSKLLRAYYLLPTGYYLSPIPQQLLPAALRA